MEHEMKRRDGRIGVEDGFDRGRYAVSVSGSGFDDG